MPSLTPLPLAKRGFVLNYRIGEANECPGCGGAHWHVGRQMAECGHCFTALPLADPSERRSRQPARPSAFRLAGWRGLAPA